MELRHESYTAHCSGWQWKVAELVSISAYLLIQPIAPASVPSPRYCSCFSPLPSVSLLLQSFPLGIAPASVPTEEGRSPRGCHGGGAVAARVPRRGWAPRECHGGGGGRRAGATVSLLIQFPPLGISYLSSTGLRLASKN